MKSVKPNKRYGFSLVEILVAVAIFALLAGGVTFSAIDSVRTVRTLEERAQAVGYINEVTEVLLLLKNQSWGTIIEHADGTEKGLVFSEGGYQIVDGAQDFGDYLVSFVGVPVFRDENNVIVPSGGTEDLHTRVITVTVTWNDILGVTRTQSSVLIVNDWNTERWRQTTEADFQAGTHDLTRVENNFGGEVELEQIVFADWCKPSLSMTAYDLPGQGITQSIVAGVGEVYLGTGANASGISYIGIGVDEADPPNVVVDGQFDGYKTNDIFGEPGYAYIATDANAKEVVIIDTSTGSYHEEGYFDAPGPADASAVVVSGTVGYVVTGSSLYSFDLTAKSGNRPMIGPALSLSGTARGMKIQGGYLFVTTSNTTRQMEIVDIADPAAKTKVGWASLNAAGGVEVSLNEDGTRAYVATAADLSKAELFIVDLTAKTGERPVIASYDTSGMSPKGVAVVSAPRVIIVGSGGEEYQVVNIENEALPTRCGGMEIASGVNDVSTYVNSLGTAYSYIATGDTASEFKIIKGGPGGGGDDGQGYAVLGTFVSQVFDSGGSSAVYFSIDVVGTVPASGDIRVQARAFDTPEPGPEVQWFGPDGTAATYFVVDGSQSIPSIANHQRYIQFKVELLSDTESTPVLEEVVISYQQ